MSHDGHESPSDGSAITRRALTRGVAWTVPLVATGVAAPAYAVSVGELRVTWEDIRFVGDFTPGLWLMMIRYTNLSEQNAVTVTKFEFITGYTFPAVNGVPGQVVLTSTIGLPTIGPGATFDDSQAVDYLDYAIPPLDGDGNNIGERYYCGNACERIQNEGTVLRFTFTAGGGPEQTLDVPVSLTIPCDEDECV